MLVDDIGWSHCAIDAGGLVDNALDDDGYGGVTDAGVHDGDEVHVDAGDNGNHDGDG